VQSLFQFISAVFLITIVVIFTTFQDFLNIICHFTLKLVNSSITSTEFITPKNLFILFTVVIFRLIFKDMVLSPLLILLCPRVFSVKVDLHLNYLKSIKTIRFLFCSWIVISKCPSIFRRIYCFYATSS